MAINSVGVMCQQSVAAEEAVKFFSETEKFLQNFPVCLETASNASALGLASNPENNA